MAETKKNAALFLVLAATLEPGFKSRVLPNPMEDHWPMCEQCDEEMNPYTDPNTGKDGFGCDKCGWSEDNQDG